MKAATLHVPVNVTHLGGVDHIDRNCAVIKSENQLLLLDCDQLFSDFDLLGIAFARSNSDHVRRNKEVVGRVAATNCATSFLSSQVDVRPGRCRTIAVLRCAAPHRKVTW